MLGLLTADYAPSLPMPDAEQTAAVRQSGPGEWLLTLTDDPDTPGIDLILSHFLL